MLRYKNQMPVCYKWRNNSSPELVQSPRARYLGFLGEYHVLVVDFSSPSLENWLNECRRIVLVKMGLMVRIQPMRRFELVHSKSLLQDAAS